MLRSINALRNSRLEYEAVDVLSSMLLECWHPGDTIIEFRLDGALDQGDGLERLGRVVGRHSIAVGKQLEQVWMEDGVDVLGDGAEPA
jgi:hypothetical protein